MTGETKRTLLEYMSGKLESNCGDNIPQFTDLNNKTNNLEDMFKERNINFSILGFVENPKTSNILLYGNNSKSGIAYGVIVILDTDFNVLDIIEKFNTGTKFRKFVCLDFDNDGNCYGIDNNEENEEPNKYRFILLNNFLIKLGDKYQVTLRNSYYFPDEYNQMTFDNVNNPPNKIMKKDFSNAYYSFFGDYNSKGRLITLKINVGAGNEWKHYDFSENISPALFDYTISFLEDSIDFDICVINETNFYRLKNVGDVINKYFELSLGDISFAQSLIKINDNKIYLTTTKGLPNNVYETKIMMISNNKLYEIFSETKESAYLSNICRLISKNNDCFVIRYNFRNDPNIFYNVDFYAGILFDNKYYEKYLGYFELSSYSAGNMFVKNEFNLFKICVLDLNNIKYSNLVYNSLNYNGTPCIQPNSLVANSGILYQDNMPVFARNLYNKSLNDNLTVSTIEVPNNYLNNILVNKEVLKSKTNLSLVDKSEQIIKNEYENVYVNFLNTINMRNENDPQRPVSNLTGAIRVNNSINLENDVDNTKVTKCKIVYDSGKEVVSNIQVDLANNTVTDSNPTLTNSLNKKINYLKVEGKTVQNGTPTPDAPIEIQNVKGYRNLLDETLINKSDNTYWVTDKISGINIQANKDYYFTTYTSMSVIRVLELGTDKVIKEVTDTIELTFNVENATKVYFTIYKAENIPTDTKILFIEGSTQRPYVPYGSNYLELKSNSKNLFNIDTLLENQVDVIRGTLEKDLYNKSITIKSTGDDCYISNTYHMSKEPSQNQINGVNRYGIPILPNTKYTWSFDVSNLTGTGSQYMFFYDENYVFLYLKSISVNKNGRASITIQTEANVKYVCFRFGLSKTGYVLTVKNVQFEKGDKATGYEQYQENSTLVNLQNNEICEGDTLIVQNGYASIDKNKKILELTGEESWGFNNDIGGYYQYYIKIENSKPNGLSNFFKYSMTGYTEGNKLYISTIGNFVFMHPIYQGKDIEGLDNWKQFLRDMKSKGTPVIVQYELANNENIGLGLQEQLTAYDNLTYVSCNDDLQPNLEVNYLINENYSTLSTTIYVDELLKKLQFISNDEKTVYQTIDISNLKVGNYYTINQRMEVK